MDDMLVWDRDKARLRDVRDQVQAFLRQSLHLELKPVWQERMTDDG